jgi:regulator of replication initiation timing
MENTDAEQRPTPKQATTMSDLQQQLDELKRNIDREVSRRVKNTFESNGQLKLEVRNLRAEVTDLRASNKAAIGERDKLHSELVEVRSALATVSAERDSLRTTLASWEAADTTPFVKVPDVADHVMPPVMPVPVAELPLCDKCHTCGMTLKMRPGKIACRATLCRSNLLSDTMMWDYDVIDIAHPYHEPCRSWHPVRHE